MEKRYTVVKWYGMYRVFDTRVSCCVTQPAGLFATHAMCNFLNRVRTVSA